MADHRLRTGKIARHQRLPRDRPLYYNEWEIPAGVRMSQPRDALSAQIFPLLCRILELVSSSNNPRPSSA